jgi:glucosamine--fructose-6-phosphate aminotransferase (isomerizing)
MSAPDTHLEREIREQPAALERFLVGRASEPAAIARALHGRELRYVMIAARGSSDNAARYAQYLSGQRMGLPVALAAPSLETLYGAAAVARHGEALVIGISQSGRSPDIVEVVAAARGAGTPTIAITNDGDSPLAHAADFLLELGVGPERSVAATKTYTASLAALAALVAELRDDEQDRGALRHVPSLLRHALDDAFATVDALDAYADAAHVVTVGRGYNYATAMEIALKVRELTATVAEGFSSADLMHGPIAAIAPGTPAVIVAAPGRALASVLETADALRRRGAHPILIAEAPHADLPLPYPSSVGWSVQAAAVAAMQCAGPVRGRARSAAMTAAAVPAAPASTKVGAGPAASATAPAHAAPAEAPIATAVFSHANASVTVPAGAAWSTMAWTLA